MAYMFMQHMQPQTPDWRRCLLDRFPAMSAEIIQEIAQHLADRYWDLIAGGESHETAYRNAVERELGTGSELRVQSGGGNMFGNVGQDFRYASRAVRKRPQSVATVVVAAFFTDSGFELFVITGVILRRRLRLSVILEGFFGDGGD